jgi:sulfoacetaldehyde acetyltransferase
LHFSDVRFNQNLFESFLRDAMKKPVQGAGISRDDMRAQAG